MGTEIKIYECGFGDCFRIANEYKTLYVDFGTLSSSYKKEEREKKYNQIIEEMPEYKDFLLTHYHQDHYSGAIYMAEQGEKFDNVYIPDIWLMDSDLKILRLDLARDLFLNKTYTLYDFLNAICKSNVYLVRAGRQIQNHFIALWPNNIPVTNHSIEVVEKHIGADTWRELGERAEEVRKIIYRIILFNNRINSNSDNPYSENYKDDIQKIREELGSVYDEDSIEEIITVIEEEKEKYLKIAENVNSVNYPLIDLSKYGNSISIVFQNRNEDMANILFTGDVGKTQVWDKIKNNKDDKRKLKEKYDVIKVPHHGTSGYYFSFKNLIDEKSVLIIPNSLSKLERWGIDKRYFQDAKEKNCKIICSGDMSCVDPTIESSKIINLPLSSASDNEDSSKHDESPFLKFGYPIWWKN